MKKEVIIPDGIYSAQARGISHAIKAGDTIYIAGQVALDEERNVIGEGDCTAQAIKVFENIRMVLEAAGADLKDIVKLTTFVKGFENMEAVRQVRRKYFAEDYFPANTMVVIESLIIPELLVEIEAVAVV